MRVRVVPGGEPEALDRLAKVLRDVVLSRSGDYDILAGTKSPPGE